jgi:HEPN domain-containing protein
MDLEKLERLAKLVLMDLSHESSVYSFDYSYSPQLEVRFRNLMVVARDSLPEYKELFDASYGHIRSFNTYQASSVITHLLIIIELEKESRLKIQEVKIFESAEEKLKQANISFRREDYTSTIHNLNTALELVLKDKIGIPITISNVNTSSIIDVLTKYKIEPFLYLEEARKHVLMIDNKIKHNAYSPSKIDCINGIKAMEELIAKLRNTTLKLTDEVKNKIYEGL